MPTKRLFAAIYVDADLTPRIVPALHQRGYECKSAIENGMRRADDESILSRATELDMVLLTNNDRDFSLIARQWVEIGRDHAGILISEQFRNRELGELLRRLLRFLDTVAADEIYNTVRYLSEFR